MKKEYRGFRPAFLIIILITYLLALFDKSPGIFSYRFDTSLAKRYLCSQDIPYEPPCKRLFLSDSDIHIAAGYLYVKGADPVSYNFQHPPLIKYLFGYSILLSGNPYFAQIGLGMIFLSLTYLLAFKLFKRAEISFLACLFLIVDPLFLNLSSHALIDLGQGALLLFYTLSVLFNQKNYLLQGVALGLLIASKFFGGSLFFIAMLAVYLVYKREFNLRRYVGHLIIAFAVFSLVYTRSFLAQKMLFNILFFELKTIKYWFHHSTASVFGSSLFLFLTGYMKSWWGNKSVVRGDPWSFMWPVIFLLTIFRLTKMFVEKVIGREFLITLIPVGYLFYLGFQAPFTRYFILVLPFFYIIFAEFIIKKSGKLIRI